jgi:small GTP-binding protein
MEEIEHEFKVVFVEDSTVGKISLMHCYSSLSLNMQTTLGATSTTIFREVDNKKIKLNIWDTPGQEAFRDLVPIYAKNSNAAVFVFDHNKKETFLHVEKWVKEIQKNLGEILCFLVANKSNLPPAISSNELDTFAKQQKMNYFLTSVVENLNTPNLFIEIEQKLANKINEDKKRG